MSQWRNHFLSSVLAMTAVSGYGGPALAQTCPEHEYLGNYPREWSGPYAEEAQGVAHDDAHWILSQKDALWQIPVESDLVNYLDSPLPAPIPTAPEGAVRVPLSRDVEEMMARHAPDNESDVARYDHFGDPDQIGGYIFVPIEGSAHQARLPTGETIVFEPAPPPIVGVYRAADLAFVGSAVLTANRDRGRNTAWIATRRIDGEVRLYSSYSEVSETEPVFEYVVDLDAIAEGDVEAAIAFRGNIWLDTPRLRTVQGGVFSPYGDLYLVNGTADDEIDEVNGGIHVFAPNGSLLAESQSAGGLGGFKYEYHPTFSRYEEPEGIDWWDRSTGAESPNVGGQLHVMLLDNGDGFFESDAVYLKHYDVSYECKAGVDSDGDGLTDYDEVEVHGTDPYDADSDGDGLYDGDELDVWGTDPLTDADADADGLSDAEEVLAHGTDPLDPDTGHWRQCNACTAMRALLASA